MLPRSTLALLLAALPASAAPKPTTFSKPEFTLLLPGPWKERPQTSAPAALPEFASRKLYELTNDSAHAHVLVNLLKPKEKFSRPAIASQVTALLSNQLATISSLAGTKVAVDGPILTERGASFEGRARVVDEANAAVTFIGISGLADRVLLVSYTLYGRPAVDEADQAAGAVWFTLPPSERAQLWSHGVPLRFTPTAVAAMRLKMAEKPADYAVGIRVAVRQEGDGFRYQVGVEETIAPGDLLFVRDGVRFFVDPTSARYLQGATVDFSPVPEPGGFVFTNPNSLGENKAGAARLKPAYWLR
jgi:iron-sulfur cluster assembly accessory protein